MTKAQALFIKVLRLRWEYSWRAVSINYQIRYIPKEDWWFNNALLEIDPDKTIPHGNQIEGMELCSKAMCLLNETVEYGWN